MNSSKYPALPYTDTKPQGAADFYFAINATFRFLLRKLGREGFQLYLAELARGYFEPVNRQWRDGGLGEVARYWRAFFSAEPGAEVDVIGESNRVEILVRVCPAIKHLRTGERQIVREYCQHCFYLGSARALEAGLTMRLQGGNGTCRHTYALSSEILPPQEMDAIAEAHT